MVYFSVSLFNFDFVLFPAGSEDGDDSPESVLVLQRSFFSTRTPYCKSCCKFRAPKKLAWVVQVIRKAPGAGPRSSSSQAS